MTPPSAFVTHPAYNTRADIGLSRAIGDADPSLPGWEAVERKCSGGGYPVALAPQLTWSAAPRSRNGTVGQFDATSGCVFPSGRPSSVIEHADSFNDRL